MKKQLSTDLGTEKKSIIPRLFHKEVMNLLWIYIWVNLFQLHDVIYSFFNSIRVNTYWSLQTLKRGFKHINSYGSYCSMEVNNSKFNTQKLLA